MQVISIDDAYSARCQSKGEEHLIDTRLVTCLAPGDWVMTHLGAAREKIDAETASQSLAALDALNAVMAGEPFDIEAAFPDLVGREPRLPDHLLSQEDPS